MLGEKIRTLRKSKNMKLGDLAQSSSLSVSYISQLERNLIEPSLSSLRKISTALDIPIYLLMEDQPPEDLLIRKKDRVTMSFPDSPISYELISAMPQKQDFSPKMLAAQFIMKPESEDAERYTTHFAEEIIILHSGVIEVTLGDDVFTLKPGDCVYVRENVPHKIRCLSPEGAEGYFIASPPRLPGKNSRPQSDN